MKKKLDVAIIPIPDLVFFPGTVLPVQFVDSRHINMIFDCIEKETPLGIALASEPLGNNSYGTVEYICGVGTPMILEQAEDGALKVLLKGTSKVKLGSIKQNLPYLIYEATVINDVEGDIQQIEGNQLEKLKRNLLEWINGNIVDSVERQTFLSTLTHLQHYIDYTAMYTINDCSIKQLVLEKTSLAEKVQLLGPLLDRSKTEFETSLIANAMRDFEKMDYPDEKKIAH